MKRMVQRCKGFQESTKSSKKKIPTSTAGISIYSETLSVHIHIVKNGHYVAHCICRFCQHCFFAFVQIQFDDALDTVFSKNYRNSQEDIFHAVFSVQPCAHWEHTFLVTNNCFYHLSSSSTRCIPCRCSEQFNNLTTTKLGALNNFIQFFCRDQFSNWNPSNCCVTWKWNHGITVTTHQNCLNVFWRNAQFQGKERTVTRCIQYPRHSENVL